MKSGQRQESSKPPPPTHEAEARVRILNTCLTIAERVSAESLSRMETVIDTAPQQISKHAICTMTLFRIVMTADDITIEDVLARKQVRVTAPARISRVVNPFPKTPIPKGITPMWVTTLSRAIPTSEILTELEARNMEFATPLHLGALINSRSDLVLRYPLTTFATISRGRRFLQTHLLPYSIRRDEKERLVFEVHKPNFWMNRLKNEERPTPIQLLLVPKTA